jgi:hypothetical protein
VGHRLGLATSQLYKLIPELTAAWAATSAIRGCSSSVSLKAIEWSAVRRDDLDTHLLVGGDLVPVRETTVTCDVEDLTDSVGVVIASMIANGAPVRETPQSPNRPDVPWIVRSTAMVSHFYFYVIDDDFGPFFLEFYTYFPYSAKLCIGHKCVKRQLDKQVIPYEVLDNGILSCGDPKRLQQISDGL